MEELIKALAKELRKKYSKIYITDEPLSSTPPRFPSVSIVEEYRDIYNTHATFEKKRNVLDRSIYIEIYGKYEECSNVSLILEKQLCDTYRYNMTLNQPLSTENNVISRRVMRFTKNDIIIEED